MALLPPGTGTQVRAPADANVLAAIVRTTPLVVTMILLAPVLALLQDMEGTEARHVASHI